MKTNLMRTKLLSCLSKPFNIFILSLIINIILFALFFCFISPHFQTNDDNAMMDIASGVRTGQPSEYLIFINVIVGKLLVFLYSAFTNINWYPSLFYFIHFVSITVIFYCLLVKNKNIYSISIYLLMFSFFELYLLTNLQFTTTAFIVGASGLILFFTFLDIKGKGLYFAIAGSVILVIISSLIRKNVFYLVMGLSAVIFLFKFLEKKSWKIPTFLIIVVMLFSLCNQFNENYYQKDENWASYMEYNNVRGKIHGYPGFTYSDINKNIYSDVGWSNNDVNMFRAWFFSDLELYSKEKLEYVLSNIKIEREIKSIGTTIKKSFINLDLKARWFTGFFLTIVILVGDKRKNKYILSVFLAASLITIYLSYFGRLPDWIFFPIIFFINIVIAFFVCENKINLNTNVCKILNNIIMKITVLMICIALSSFMFVSTSNSSKINEIKQEELEGVVEKINDRDKIYISWGATGLTDKTILFYNPYGKANFNKVPLGWSTHSPHYNKILNNYSIENLYKDIVEREDIFIICTGNEIEMFEKFMYEHHNMQVSAVSIDEIEISRRSVYKVQRNELKSN